jgi:hypothetical protein
VAATHVAWDWAQAASLRGEPIVRLWLLAGLMASVSVTAAAAEVAGIELADRTTVGRSELVLNGAGLRKKLFFGVYVAGLYLEERTQAPADVLALAGPKRLSITLLRDLSARELVAALDGGVRDNCSPAEQKAVRVRLDQLTAALLSVGRARKGDVITFDWVPDVGTLVFVSGKARSGPIPGDDFFQALLRVWVGAKPTDGGLKRALLGQAQ